MKTTCTPNLLIVAFAAALAFVTAIGQAAGQAAEALPSWNNGKAKQSIIEFVTKVTKEGSPDFVPPAERIAVFDNDGTLWTEKPFPTHVYAILDRIKQQLAADATLKDRQPYKAIAAKDKEYFVNLYENQAYDTILGELMAVPFGGVTTTDYANWHRAWFKDWKHPKFGVGVGGLIYQPMVELIRYLEANGFTSYIFTADEGAFVRVVAQDIYGLPPARVQGSRVWLDYGAQDGKSGLVRAYRSDYVDNWAGKPQLIEQVIGARPILAGGNSNGDEHMLQYVALQDRRSLSLLIHHTDEAREFAYDSHTDKVLPRAAKEGWTVVDMKNDWKQIFAKEASPVTAIDILLEPDATMLRHAEANNARLLKAFPNGFALDAAHRPHITMIQRFFSTEDLDKVYAVAEKVFAAADVTGIKLQAFKCYYAPGAGVGVAGICARPTPELLKLQADIIAAVAPFTVETGAMTTFTAKHDDPALDAVIIEYVSTFVPKQSGEHFNPHVSTGVAPREYLDKMLAEPFEPFTFSPAGAAVYQLGPYGTAAKKLREWRWESARKTARPSSR